MRTKAKELMDADVRYISLVDRAASRMPFRILKRDAEGGMGIDLSNLKKVIFKSEKAHASVSAVVVFEQKAEEMEAVRKAVEAAGFKTDKVVKNEDGTTISYVQTDEPMKDAKLVRLSGDMVVAVKGFSSCSPSLDDSDFSDSAAANSFYQGVDASLDVLFQKICKALQDAGNEGDAADVIGGQIDGFKKYVVGLVEALPTAAFKADIAVREALAVKTEMTNVAKTGSGVTDIEELLKKAPDGATIAEPEWTNMGTFDKMTWIYASYNKANKDGAQAGDGAAQKSEKCAKCGSTEHMTSDHVEKQEPVAVADETAKKLDQVLAAVAGLATKVDGIEKKQAAMETSVKEAATKSEEVAKKIQSVVTAAPAGGDFPKPGEKTATKKADPRTGNFDTAMLPRARRQ